MPFKVEWRKNSCCDPSFFRSLYVLIIRMCHPSIDKTGNGLRLSPVVSSDCDQSNNIRIHKID